VINIDWCPRFRPQKVIEQPRNVALHVRAQLGVMNVSWASVQDGLGAQPEIHVLATLTTIGKIAKTIQSPWKSTTPLQDVQ
jgi:hypothetical protein